MPLVMRSRFRGPCLAATAILCLVASPGVAQVPLVDGTTPSAASVRARYDAAVSALVDSVVIAWQAAYAERNAKDLAEVYASDAIITLTGGGTLVGRKAIRQGFERLFTRMRDAHITIDDLNRMGEVVLVRGTVIGRMTGPAGSYEHVGTIALQFRTNSWARLEIAAQRGGDVLTLIPLSPSSAARADLTPDTVRVRLMDASGNGVRNAEIAFTVTGKHAAIAPDSAATDAQGIASAVFTASALQETDVVTARATLAPDEPAFFRFQRFAPEALAAAVELVRATGARPHFDSAFSHWLAGRRREMPDVPREAWDAVSADSAVNIAVGLLVSLYAERLSVETMRSISEFYESPAGREFVAVRPLFDEAIPAAEREWSALIDQRSAAKLRPARSAPPR